MFSYDVVILADSQTILKKFIDFNASIVIGAEKSCWPDITLADQYPPIDSVDGYKFINSGGLVFLLKKCIEKKSNLTFYLLGIIGYADQLYKLLSMKTIKDLDDDQLHLTKLYLTPEIRDKLNIKLDSHAHLFQNLYAMEG